MAVNSMTLQPGPSKALFSAADAAEPCLDHVQLRGTRCLQSQRQGLGDRTLTVVQPRFGAGDVEDQGQIPVVNEPSKGHGVEGRPNEDWDGACSAAELPQSSARHTGKQVADPSNFYLREGGSSAGTAGHKQAPAMMVSMESLITGAAG